MIRNCFALVCLLALLCSSKIFALPPQWGSEHGNRPADVLSPDRTYCLGQAIVKFDFPLPNLYNPNGTPIKSGQAELDSFFAKYDVYFLRNLTPLEKEPKNGNLDCRWVYWLQFPPEIPVEDFLIAIKHVQDVVTVGKNGLWAPDFTPNDPQVGSEWHVNTINCNQAWDFTLGDSTVVISICDMGTDVLHHDLAPNIWINPGEDINHDHQITSVDSNHIDNDLNGYVDDFYGWDFTDNDNNVQDRRYWSEGFGHGTHVAGCASAATNNGLGVASPGSRAKLMICRMSVNDSERYLSYAFGLSSWSYSNANGAKIMNNSWGAIGSPDPNIQNEITACFNNGVLMISAAGNNGLDSTFYPARYTNMIAVAASQAGDGKAGFSNYGNWINITAPGDAILSTIFDGTHVNYGAASGTSMASPVTCGCAALLWSVMPGASSIAVRDTLFHNAKNIDSLNLNLGTNKLGWGRVDIGKAVATQFPFDTLSSFLIKDTINGVANGQADPGDTVCIRFSVANSAGHTSGQNIYYKLNLNDSQILPLVDSIYVGNRPVNSSFSSNQFKFFVPLGTPIHHSTFQIVTGGRNPNNFSFHRTMSIQTIPIGTIPLLLIDDDGTDIFDWYYERSLDSINEQWDVWHVTTQGVPDTVTLSKYSDFIWFTGNRMTNVLTTTEQDRIIWLQTNGKRLLFSSQGAGSSLGTTSFHQQWLHANWNGTLTEHWLTGNSGDVLSNAMNLYLVGAGGGGANDYQVGNILSPTNNSASAWNYSISGSAGAVYVRTNGQLSFVYCGFPVEAINASDINGTYVTRSAFLQRILYSFRQTDVMEPVTNVLPKSYELKTPYPNPFNPTTTIQYSLPASGTIRVVVYDVTGREVATLVNGFRRTGVYATQWNAAQLASGMYFVRLVAGTHTITKKALFVK